MISKDPSIESAKFLLTEFLVNMDVLAKSFFPLSLSLTTSNKYMHGPLALICYVLLYELINYLFESLVSVVEFIFFLS